MSTIFFFVAAACMAAVLVSLLVGLVAMGKGGEKDHRTSNKMMQFRIIFQAAAIFFLFMSFLAK